MDSTSAWRAALQPASFGGVTFHVEVGGQGGGRRLANHVYPKADKPFAEDMGRLAHTWQISAYLIGPDYTTDRDALLAVLDSEGPYTLVHPTLGAFQAHCGPYTESESRERGGFAQVDIQFFEAGQNPDASGSADTQAQAQSAASASNDASAATVDSSLANATPVTTPLPTVDGGYGGISASYPNSGRIGGIGSA